MDQRILLPVIMISLLGTGLTLADIADRASAKTIAFAEDAESALDCAFRGLPLEQCSPGLMTKEAAIRQEARFAAGYFQGYAISDNSSFVVRGKKDWLVSAVKEDRWRIWLTSKNYEKQFSVAGTESIDIDDDGNMDIRISLVDEDLLILPEEGVSIVPLGTGLIILLVSIGLLLVNETLALRSLHEARKDLWHAGGYYMKLAGHDLSVKREKDRSVRHFKLKRKTDAFKISLLTGAPVMPLLKLISPALSVRDRVKPEH